MLQGINCFGQQKEKSWLDRYLEDAPNTTAAPQTSSVVAASIVPTSEIPQQFLQPNRQATDSQDSEGGWRSFQPQPRVSADDLSKIGHATSNFVTSNSLVHVNGYQRGGVDVSPYYRQPPGGISTTDQLKGDAAGLLVVAGVVFADYLSQAYDHQKASIPVPPTPKYPIVTSVKENSLAAQAKIAVGDYILSYNSNSLGWAESSNNPLLYKIEQAKQQGAKTAEVLIFRNGNYLRAIVPAGEMIGVTISEGELPLK